jgi:hypothetical protein
MQHELSPSPLNGERAGVRGGNVIALNFEAKALGITTPHPQSLSPLRGEGGSHRCPSVFIRGFMNSHFGGVKRCD